MLFGQLRQSLVVDPLVAGAHAVTHEVVPLAANVHGRAVRQVAPLVEPHAEDGVTGLEHGQVSGQVGIGAGVGLHIGVLRSEKLARPPAGQFLGLVDHEVAPVIPLSRVALGVLIGQDGPGRRQDGAGSEVFGGYELEGGVLALSLSLDDGEQFCIWEHYLRA